MKLFYVFSIKYSFGQHVASWWGPNNCGYVHDLAQAGRYTEEQIKAEVGYYDNHNETCAIPCEEVERLATLTLSADKAFTLFRRLRVARESGNAKPTQG